MQRIAIFLVATATLTGCTLSLSSTPGTVSAPVVVDDQSSVEIVQETEVPVIAVDEYYFVGGHYYYWHPGVGRYVVLRGYPPHGFRVRSMARLEPRRVGVRPVEHREVPHPAVRTPQHQPAPTQKQPPPKKKQENK